MHNLPPAIIQVLRHFERAFSERVWEWAKILLIGALLTPGQRTVTQALRVMGLCTDAQFQNYHRVLNRASWSSYALSRSLLRLLIATFVPDDAVIVVGLDETLERRRGRKIAAKGIYRDPVRSSKDFFVKTSGLRWMSMQLLVTIPWAKRVWGLPFLTVLAPSERYHQQRGLRHKKLTDWGRQMILQVRRWLPTRHLVICNAPHLSNQTGTFVIHSWSAAAPRASTQRTSSAPLPSYAALKHCIGGSGGTIVCRA